MTTRGWPGLGWPGGVTATDGGSSLEYHRHSLISQLIELCCSLRIRVTSAPDSVYFLKKAVKGFQLVPFSGNMFPKTKQNNSESSQPLSLLTASLCECLTPEAQ